MFRSPSARPSPSESIEARACEIAAEALKTQAVLSIDDDMASLPQWDSLSHMRVILGLEVLLGRQLATEEIMSVTRVWAIADLLATDSRAKASRCGEAD